MVRIGIEIPDSRFTVCMFCANERVLIACFLGEPLALCDLARAWICAVETVVHSLCDRELPVRAAHGSLLVLADRRDRHPWRRAAVRARVRGRICRARLA